MHAHVMESLGVDVRGAKIVRATLYMHMHM